MSIYDQLLSRESIQNTYPLFPVYRNIYSDFQSTDLRSVMASCPHLTFSQDRESGFEEIDVISPPCRFVPDYTEQYERLSEYCRELLNRLYRYLDQFWNVQQTHVVMVSGGKDSRILLYTLYKLSQERDLGKFILLCHEPEQVELRKAMEALQWKKPVMVWKEGKFGHPDYYRLGDFPRNVNAFIGYDFQYWDQTVNPSKSVLIAGLGGGELFDYPSQRKPQFPYKNAQQTNLGQMVYHFRSRFAYLKFAEIYQLWQDVLFPYLGYEYLNLAFQVPRKYFKGKDIIRNCLLKMIGAKPPYYRSHNYQIAYSPSILKKIQTSYNSSRFYNDFKELSPFVRNARPMDTITDRLALDSRIYGLASVYEGVHHD